MFNSVDVILDVKLDASSIDQVSETLAQNLLEDGIVSKEVARSRICVEEVMRVWGEQLGEDKECRLVREKYFSKSYYAVYVEGKSVDPIQYEDSLFSSISNNPNMVKALGLNAEYRYAGGVNKLMIYSSTKHSNPMKYVLFALFLALVIGSGLRLFVPDIATMVASTFVKPLLDTLMKMIRLISVPLIFLSIVCGINGMEDVAVFGKIGKRMIKRIIGMTIVFASICWFIISFWYPLSFSESTSSGNSIEALLALVLDIVPSDLVSPIQTGNALQIIFVAVCLGVGMLFISDDTTISMSLLNQLNSVVQLLMRGISRILPALIFLCVMNFTTNSDAHVLVEIMIPLVTIILICLLFVLGYGLYASIVSKIPYFTLLKHQLPSYLLALSTASSAAVFNTNIECCCEKLKIDKFMAIFAIPFGQILFMPGAVVDNVVITVFMASKYGIDMTPSWVLSLILMATIIAIAAPPIPGGALSGITIIFSQLGLPMEAIPFATTIMLFSDYFSTACNIACLQQELLIETSSASTLPFRKK